MIILYLFKVLQENIREGSDWKVLRREQGMDSPFWLLGKF